MFLSVVAPIILVQVVCEGCKEWDSIWPFCSSPKWLAHHIISQEIDRYHLNKRQIQANPGYLHLSKYGNNDFIALKLGFPLSPENDDDQDHIVNPITKQGRSTLVFFLAYRHTQRGSLENSTKKTCQLYIGGHPKGFHSQSLSSFSFLHLLFIFLQIWGKVLKIKIVLMNLIGNGFLLKLVKIKQMS